MQGGYGNPGPAYDPSAEDALPSFGELFGPPGDPSAAVSQARCALGLPAPVAPAFPGLDVTGLAEALGLS